MTPQEAAKLPGHGCLPEPLLAFHAERSSDQHVHPLRGLVEFGPLSRSLLSSVLDPIRVATIVPAGMQTAITSLIAEAEGRHRPRERPNYLIEFPGFSRVFGVRLVRAGAVLHLELPTSIDSELAAAANPHLVLAERLTQAIRVLERQRTEFDVLLVLLPERWEAGFYGPAGDDFDLHAYLKAITASRALPLQVVREGRALSYPCRCSVMWRLGIALYCKAGGIPWKLAEPVADTAFIGLSYAIRATGGGPHFVTCCSQVFDADGAGLEFVAYETGEARVVRENPFLPRTDMRRVITRSLQLYLRRHAGRRPKRLVVHKSSEFKPDEVEGCFDAWGANEGLELVQVQQDVAWRGLQVVDQGGRPKGQPSGFPCERGSFLQIGGREVLLWTQGNAPSAAGGKNFFKEGKGIPVPLLLRRFAGHGAWIEPCRNVLALTKMDWNNDGLYDRLPVTMGFAKVLADTVKRMTTLGSAPYQFRFFM